MFNPNEHLIKIGYGDKAQDYLQVMWRLVWFREQCPEGTIDTEEIVVDLDREVEAMVDVWNAEKRRKEKVVKRAKGYARFKAVVTDGKGGRATGTKSETAAGFDDFIEKAETGAIGRALAGLGFGTQFTGDEFSEGTRIVDSPVGIQEEQESATTHTGGQRPATVANQPASPRKLVPAVKAAHEQPQPAPPTPKASPDGQRTPAPAAQSNGSRDAGRQPTDADGLATEQQMASIRKLCERLGKLPPQGEVSQASARTLLQQLSAEYKEHLNRESATPAPATNGPVTHERVNAIFKAGNEKGTWRNIAMMRQTAEEVIKRNLTGNDHLAALKSMTDFEAHSLEEYVESTAGLGVGGGR